VNRSLILAGVGGQGTVLASKWLAQAAMNQGLKVRTAETIGMAQRGGCVVSHVRIGEEAQSSLVPLGGADLILGFEPAEAVRCLPYLKTGGAAVVSTREIPSFADALKWDSAAAGDRMALLRQRTAVLITLDGVEICGACGSPGLLNGALLGAAAAAGLLGFTENEMAAAISDGVAPRFVDMNLRALQAGAKAARLIETPPTYGKDELI
jgi:indolepyruvate ferredoxin oxidoreductase beta subunit